MTYRQQLKDALVRFDYEVSKSKKDDYIEQLDQAITSIVALGLELIGEDEEPDRTFGPGMPSFQRDELRQQLRSKLKEASSE